MTKIKNITYAEAINEAMSQSMKMDSKVITMGQLIDYKSGIFGTTSGLVEKFGNETSSLSCAPPKSVGIACWLFT